MCVWDDFQSDLLGLIPGDMNEEAEGCWTFIHFPGNISTPSGMSTEPVLGLAFCLSFLRQV